MVSMITLEQYLEKLAKMADNEYGRLIRQNFADDLGSSELAMLESPNKAELDQIKKAVAIMTPTEKDNAHLLTDEQVERIGRDAGIDLAVFAIFINGYSIYLKRVRAAKGGRN